MPCWDTNTGVFYAKRIRKVTPVSSGDRVQDTAPVSVATTIIVQVMFSLTLSIFGIVKVAGELKDIDAAAEIAHRSWETFGIDRHSIILIIVAESCSRRLGLIRFQEHGA